MDAATGGSDLLILLHPIDEQLHGGGLEVNVAVQGKKEGVIGDDLLATSVWQLLGHQAMTQQVVHVHHLVAYSMVPLPRSL